MTGGIEKYDIRYFEWNMTALDDAIQTFLNTPKNQVCLNIIKSEVDPIIPYHLNNETVYDNFVDDAMNTTVPVVDELLNRPIKYPLIIYAGDFDTVDGPVTQEGWIYQLKWKGLEQFHEAERYLYYY